jgi:hypothetical protein
MKIDLDKLCTELIEEKKRKKKRKSSKNKRSSKYYGWGWMGYGYPGVYGDSSASDGGSAGGGE